MLHGVTATTFGRPRRSNATPVGACSMADKPRYYITTAIAYPNGAAAYRPRLRGDRDRRDRALHAARRLRRVLPHRHRRARHQDAADRRPGGHHAAATGRAQRAALPGHGRAARTARTTTSSAPPRSATTAPRSAIWERMEKATATSISTNIPAGTRCATRPITTRSETTLERQGRAARPARHAGRMGGGGELFLPALRLSGQAARSLRARIPTSCCRRSGSTRSRASCGAACRTCRSRARPSTGASRCPGNRPSTSCMCGSTR